MISVQAETALAAVRTVLPDVATYEGGIGSGEGTATYIDIGNLPKWLADIVEKLDDGNVYNSGEPHRVAEAAAEKAAEAAYDEAFTKTYAEVSRCQTPRDVDLCVLRHVLTTCVHDLAQRLVCQKCRKAGGTPGGYAAPINTALSPSVAGSPSRAQELTFTRLRCANISQPLLRDFAVGSRTRCSAEELSQEAPGRRGALQHGARGLHATRTVTLGRLLRPIWTRRRCSWSVPSTGDGMQTWQPAGRGGAPRHRFSAWAFARSRQPWPAARNVR
jgi:hypothetical protein